MREGLTPARFRDGCISLPANPPMVRTVGGPCGLFVCAARRHRQPTSLRKPSPRSDALHSNGAMRRSMWMPAAVLHRLSARQRLCTLQHHELIHAHYHDIGCGSIAGLKAELRTRRETALTLISPIEYRFAESTYDGEAYSMAVELGVTMQVLRDYQTLLEQRIRYGAEMVGQQSRDIPSHDPTISACVPMSERTSMGIKIGDKNTTGVFP